MKKIKLLVLLLLLSLLSSCSPNQVISIGDYVLIETYGTDGNGRLVATFDPEIMDLLKEETDLSLFEINEVYESLAIESSNDLENGDVITPKLVMTKDVPLELRLDIDPIEVSGLPQARMVSEAELKDLLVMDFSGLSGGAELIALTLDTRDPYLLDLDLLVDVTSPISNGDTLSFRIESGSVFKQSGYVLETDSLSIEVEALPVLVTDPHDLTEEDIAWLENKGLETIESYLLQSESLELLDYVHNTNPLENYSKVLLQAPIEISEIRLTHVSLILYYSNEEVTRLQPHNMSLLHLTFEATIDGIYEDVQIGVVKNSNLVSEAHKIILEDLEMMELFPEVQEYSVWAIQNRKGDIYRLAYDEYLTWNFTNIEYRDWLLDLRG